MRIPIEIPDAILTDLVNEANARDLSPEAVVIAKLQIGMSVPAGHRYVILEGEDLRLLEGRFGYGQIASGGDLRARVERLGRVAFEGHEIMLTQAEREELHWRAKKSGKSIAQMIEAAWKEVQQHLFTYAVSDAAKGPMPAVSIAPTAIMAQKVG